VAAEPGLIVRGKDSEDVAILVKNEIVDSPDRLAV
jgi:hypothetical protein